MCDCNHETACTGHAESLYGWSTAEAVDFPVRPDYVVDVESEILFLAKVDCREFYTEE